MGNPKLIYCTNCIEFLNYLSVKIVVQKEAHDEIISDSVSIKENSETGCLVQDPELDRKHMRLDGSARMFPTSII
jgi:hypothetical protein